MVIREYDYMKEVEQFGFNVSSVNRVCKGHRKTSGGFRWKYIELEDLAQSIDCDDE